MSGLLPVAGMVLQVAAHLTLGDTREIAIVHPFGIGSNEVLDGLKVRRHVTARSQDG